MRATFRYAMALLVIWSVQLIDMPTPAYASDDASVNTIGQLLDICKYALRSMDNDGSLTHLEISKGSVCIGYVRGAEDTIRYYSMIGTEKNLCLPEGGTTGQDIALFVKWAKDHPEYWHKRSISGVVAVFQEHFRCETSK